MVAPGFAALAVASRLVLFAVFAFAGVAKLRDRHGTWAMLRAFGAGVRASDAIAPLLPWIELAVAVALVPTISARIGALAAIALLSAFTAAIVINLVHGRTPECRCFGEVANTPIGPSTVARNAVFVVLAAISLVIAPSVADPIAVSMLGANVAVFIAVVLAVVAIVQGFFLWQVIAQQGRMMRRLDDVEALTSPLDLHEHEGGARPPAGLPLGNDAPAFELVDLDGKRTSLAALTGLGKPVGLFFVHSSCGPCRALVPHIVRWSDELSKHLTVVVITEGSAAENREFLPGMASNRVLLQMEHAVGDLYLSFGTPAAVIVDARGKIASAVAGGRDAIAALLGEESRVDWGDEPARSAPLAQGLAIGSAMPEFEAPIAGGGTFHSSDLSGADATLVFWSPSCGYCRQAVGDVATWEQSGSRIVVLSSAPDEELVARGLQYPIAIDEGMRIGAMFGATGTPMAVRIASDGTVASGVAAGRDAISGLLRRSTGAAAT